MSSRPASSERGGPEVRYGTAGWNFADWSGPFYPTAPSGDDGPGALFTGVLERADPDVGLARREPLRYYARYFDCVEVNSSFYGTPSRKSAEGWARQTDVTPAGRPFLFSLKLPQRFSHLGDLDPRELRAFRDCVAPLQERERLAAVVAQFPQAFALSAEARERLGRIAEVLGDLPLVVEVRHRTWASDEGRALLASLPVVPASIDMPQGRHTLGPESLGGRPELAAVRLHGRNAAAWFDRKAQRDDKYDYLYAPAELAEWSARVDALAAAAQRTLVIANNHYRGKAPANALELRALREGRAPAAPRALREAYPRLAAGAPADRA